MPAHPMRRPDPQKLMPLLLLLAPLSLFLLMVVLPIFQSLWISFYDWDGMSAARWIGLGNYRELLADDRFHQSIRNNILWLLLFLLSPVLGLGMAIFLSQDVAGIRIIKSLFFVPLVLAHVVIAIVFIWFYDPAFGPLSLAAQALGLGAVAVLSDPDIVSFGIIAAGLWSQTAFCLVLYLAGLSQIDRDQVEAARIDGAGGFRLLYHVVLPQLRAVSFVATIVTIIGSLRSFDFVAIMTQGGPFGSSSVLAFQMFEATIFSYRSGYGAAIAVALFAIMSVYIAWFLRRTVLADETAD
jgi:multiple sugar transport system permease protein